MKHFNTNFRHNHLPHVSLGRSLLQQHPIVRVVLFHGTDGGLWLPRLVCVQPLVNSYCRCSGPPNGARNFPS